MLFSKIDFTDADVRKKLDAGQIRHQSTLEHYYLNYNNALRSVMTKGLQRSYAFNDKSRGILFLLRHSLELCLKLNLEKRGLAIPNTHDFAELTGAFADPSDIPVAIRSLMDKINYDTAGASFRYLTDGASGKHYFTYKDRIELSGILRDYHSVVSSAAFELGDIAPVFDYGSRKIAWAMTLHMGESVYLGHIKTQFSAVTEYILEDVLEDKVSLGQVYLSLLFLIRHSMELALKANITEVQAISTIIKSKDYQQEHSLMRLYNVYADYMDKIDTNKLDPTVQAQYCDYRAKYARLNSVVHQLDVNSRYFRYPFDKTGAPFRLPVDQIDLVGILELLYFTDPFLNFSNLVFEEAGILE